MLKSIVRSTLGGRDASHCLLWATLQQLVVASSTYFIIEAIQAVTRNDHPLAMKFAVAFVVSLVIVYLPVTGGVIALQKWRLSAFARFVEKFVSVNQGRTTWSHARDKSRFESWLTNESSTVYANATSILFDAYSIFLSSILNILVISVAIDGRIIGWYALAALLLLASNLLFQNKIRAVSLHSQQARKDLSNVMLNAWENILIGNRHCLHNWLARFRHGVHEASRGAVRADLTKSLISSATVSLALMVIALGNAIYFYENRLNLPMVAALLITLPRQLQVVQNIFAFFNMHLSWVGVSSQLREIAAFIEFAREPRDSASHVQMSELSTSHNGLDQRFAHIPDFMDHVRSKANGRFTLRGKNGAGKSTLLSMLAEATGEDSFYLPAHFSDLAFTDSSWIGHSDGNRVLAVFREIADLKAVRYVLLDEWDANLDPHNLAQIDEAITHLAQTKVVLESRHRG